MESWLLGILRSHPDGYVLIQKDGREHNKVRGDLIPAGSLVIVEDGISFVRTAERDSDNFSIYREDYGTFTYVSDGA